VQTSKYNARNNRLRTHTHSLSLTHTQPHEEPYVMRICEMWETADGSMLFKGQWFYRHVDLGAMKGGPKGGRDKGRRRSGGHEWLPYELALSNWMDENAIASVMGKVRVLYLGKPPAVRFQSSSSRSPTPSPVPSGCLAPQATPCVPSLTRTRPPPSPPPPPPHCTRAGSLHRCSHTRAHRSNSRKRRITTCAAVPSMVIASLSSETILPHS
jgi:hypothetical protein